MLLDSSVDAQVSDLQCCLLMQGGHIVMCISPADAAGGDGRSTAATAEADATLDHVSDQQSMVGEAR